MLDPIDIHVHAGTHGQDGRLPISHDAHNHALAIKVSNGDQSIQFNSRTASCMSKIWTANGRQGGATRRTPSLVQKQNDVQIASHNYAIEGQI